MQTQQTQGSALPPPAAFSLSESAAARINALKAQEGNPALYFRVTVKGGGCSGFQYEFNLESGTITAQDITIERDGAQVVVDDVSIGLVAGAMLDYAEDLASAGFEIKNPNATASCGCGNSFSVAL